MKYLGNVFLLVSLFTAELFALKVKAKEVDGIVKVKALIKSPMVGELQVAKRGGAPNYIKRVVAHVGGELVYDAAISPVWRRNPIIRFKYRYLGRSDVIQFTIADNMGKVYSKSFKIKNSTYKGKAQMLSKPVYSSSLIPDKVWKIQNIHDAIGLMYNTSEFKKEKITLMTSQTGDYHPDTNIVGIQSKVSLKSLSVFANIGDRPALVAIFSIPKDAIIDYRFNLKMHRYNDGPIVVVGEGRDGCLYKTISSLGLFYDEKKFIEECEHQRYDGGIGRCKQMALDISLQKLQAYHTSLMETNYLPTSRRLLLEQSEWLENRKNACPNESFECLSVYYKKRKELLETTYNVRQRGMVNRDVTCESFPGYTFPKNLKVIGIESSQGKLLSYQIGDSNVPARVVDIVVNIPHKPIALVLHGSYPTIWHIKGTKGTRIEGVLAFGQYKQFVAGLPKNIPILAGNDNRSCDLSNYQGALNSPITQALSKKVFNANIETFYKEDTIPIKIGREITQDTKVYVSDDTPTISFKDPSKPLVGIAGIKDLIEKGKVRPITPVDIDRWHKKEIAMRKEEHSVLDGKKWESQQKLNHMIHRTSIDKYRFTPGYMILEKITIPIDTSENFFVEEGVPYPNVSIGHEPTIFEFDTMTCNGRQMSICVQSRLDIK